MWNKSLRKMSKVGPTAKKIDNKKKNKITNLKLLLIIKDICFGSFNLKILYKISFENLNPIKAITIPPRISVIKCTPMITLLSDMIIAQKYKKYFNFGIIKEITKTTAKIVEVCPDGNEWKLESSVKKFKSIPFSKFTVFGLGRPIMCFNSWVIIPELKIDENSKKL